LKSLVLKGESKVLDVEIWEGFFNALKQNAIIDTLHMGTECFLLTVSKAFSSALLLNRGLKRITVWLKKNSEWKTLEPLRFVIDALKDREQPMEAVHLLGVWVTRKTPFLPDEIEQIADMVVCTKVRTSTGGYRIQI